MTEHVIEVQTNPTTIEVTSLTSATVNTLVPIERPHAYGEFLDTTTQGNTAPIVVRTVAFNTTTEASRTSLVNGTRLTVQDAGVYNFQFSVVATKSGGGKSTMEMWLAINGQDVDDSNTRVQLVGNGAEQVLAWNFLATLGAGHYLELKWYSADPLVSLPTVGPFTNPSRPRVPAAIATITQIAPA